MKIARLAGLTFMAILVVSLTAASAASAAPDPHFRWQDIETHFVALSGVSILRGVGGFPRVECKKDLALGFITSLDLVQFKLHFLECESQETETGEKCKVNSPGSEPGLILTNILHGLLGLILPRGTTSGVGLLVLPAEAGSKVFVTLEKNECTPETKVTGSVAGEVLQVAQAVTLTQVHFGVTNNSQNIKEIDVLGAKIKPELLAFAQAATEETLETIHWLTSVEVT